MNTFVDELLIMFLIFSLLHWWGLGKKEHNLTSPGLFFFFTLLALLVLPDFFLTEWLPSFVQKSHKQWLSYYLLVLILKYLSKKLSASSEKKWERSTNVICDKRIPQMSNNSLL